MPSTGALSSSDGSHKNSVTFGASAAALRAASAMPLSQASMRAPEWLRMKPTSSGCSMKLIGTMTAPSRMRA